MLVDPTSAYLKPGGHVGDGLAVAAPSCQDSVTNRSKVLVQGWAAMGPGHRSFGCAGDERRRLTVAVPAPAYGQVGFVLI